ncbi:MAG TPA: CopD family protein [Gemmatimonadaceae bacterium]|nr:CopD family protein [Gemmatimonadaceae bacterium]
MTSSRIGARRFFLKNTQFLRVFAACIILMLVAPSALVAHTKLLRSDPANGASLSASPSSIRLVFSEAAIAELASIRLGLLGASGVLLSSPRYDATSRNELIFDIRSSLAPGRYRATWSTASRDGHVIKGTIEFQVAVPDTNSAAGLDTSAIAGRPAASPDQEPESIAGVSEPSTAIAISGAFGAFAARWLGFMALFIVIGSIAFRFGVLRRLGRNEDDDSFLHIASTNAATFGIVAAVAGLLSALLRLNREIADMPDIPVTQVLGATAWGWSWLLHVIATLILASALRGVHRAKGRSRSNLWNLALGAVLAMSFVPSLSGHAIGGQTALITFPADVLHVIAGSAWLGTLTVIVVVGIPAALKSAEHVRPGARVAAMINVFSPMALICGGLVVASGVISSVVRLKPLSSLWTTPYGVTLAIKLFFVAILFGAGAWNWRRMKPRLTGDDAVVPMRSVASLEVILACVVLGITAVLVAIELP